jgi:mannosyl-3-phosphoglycerate phosphatase family protein
LVDFGNFYIKEFGQPRQHWLELIEQTTADLSHLYRGFSAMTAEELAELTGLTVKQAEKAKHRHYSEPIHWLGNDKQKDQFIERLRAQGAHVIAGGRFLHVSGGESKGIAIEWLSQFIRNEIAGDWLTVALGDGENDISMLEQADIAVQIKSVNHPFFSLQREGPTIRSTEPGPVGWHHSMMTLISELDNYRLDKIKTHLASSKEER